MHEEVEVHAKVAGTASPVQEAAAAALHRKRDAVSAAACGTRSEDNGDVCAPNADLPHNACIPVSACDLLR